MTVENPNFGESSATIIDKAAHATIEATRVIDGLDQVDPTRVYKYAFRGAEILITALVQVHGADKVLPLLGSEVEDALEDVAGLFSVLSNAPTEPGNG